MTDTPPPKRKPRAKSATPAAPRYKMKELSARSGVPAPVVHFYIQQGLLPQGHKTGRNMAWYTDEHVQRIKLIRQLQEERFLPLKAIKAALDAERDVFSPAQRATLVETMHRLGGSLKPADGSAARVSVEGMLADLGVDRADLEGLAAAGVLALGVDERGRAVVARDDLWVVQLWAEMRDAGYTRELGFTPDDLGVYVEAIETFLRHETVWLGRIVDRVPPARLAAMIERGLPLLHTFITRHHESKARALIAALAARRHP